MLFNLIQSTLHLLPPQTAHRLLLSNLGWMTTFNLHQECIRDEPDISRTVMGIRFPNNIGLAAGFDQNGTCITPLGALGFGHIEVGSVMATPSSQAYSLHRDPSRKSISYPVHCNSEGIDAVIQHIARSAPGFRVRGGVVGLNITASSQDLAAEDFRTVLRKGYRHADYFVLNLAQLQQASPQNLVSLDTMKRWLKAVDAERSRIIEQNQHTRKPIAVKLAAGLTKDALHRLLDIIVDANMDGIIAFGPLTPHTSSPDSALLSGAPIAEQCLTGLTQVVEHLKGHLAVIASGGLTDTQHISHVAQAGADLIQIHSGFVFNDPRFIGEAIETFDQHSLKFHNVKR